MGIFDVVFDEPKQLIDTSYVIPQWVLTNAASGLKSRKFINWLFFAILFAVTGTGVVNAGHIAGGNITYECIGNEEYVITLSIFRNCSESDLQPNQFIKFSSDCGHFSSISAPQIYTDEVSQLCPTALANSACSGGPWPGMEIYKYQIQVTLDSCDSWQIYWELCTRSISNNVDDSVFPCYRINAALNNIEAPCNNSPYVTQESIPYVCVNQPVSFNAGVNENDGDSLRYYLVPGLTNGGGPIPYEPGFSGLLPIPGITIGNNTGQLSFTPTATGTYTIVVEVEEYNTEGILIGTIRHDILFVVENCPQPVPQPDPGGFSNFTGSGTVVDNNIIQVCGGDQFCAEIEFSSVNAASIITLTSTVETILPGATFTTTGTNPVVGEICWTVPPGFSTTIPVNITAQDDACPVFGVAYWGFLVTPSVGVYGGPDYIICAGETIQLEASGDTDYLWQVFSGDPINTGVNISCVDCPNPVVTPAESTIYLVTGLNNTTECIATDTVVVGIALDDLSVETSSESCYLNDATIILDIPYGSGNYSFLWETGDTTQNLFNIPAGIYDLQIDDLDLGCSTSTTVEVAFPPFPATYAGPDDVSCGTTYIMQADSNAASGYWLANDNADATFFPDIYTHNAEVIVVNDGTWKFYWIEDNGDNCTGIDSVNITFANPPPIEVEEDTGVCGLNYQLEAVPPALGTANWSAGPGITFDPDINDPNAIVTVPNYGVHYITWNLDLGNECGGADSVAITFEEPIFADGGTAIDSICGDVYQLQSVMAGDSSYWSSNSPQISFSPDVNDPNATITAGAPDTYSIMWTIQTEYCTDTDTLQVTFIEPPVSDAGPDDVVCGLDYTFTAVASVGDGFWEGAAGIFYPGGDTLPGATVTVPAYDLYSFIWHEDNAFTCIDSDTVKVMFVELPIADAGSNDTICGLTYNLMATPSVGTGVWSADPEVTISDPADPGAEITVVGEGSYALTWTEDNGNGCVSEDECIITFYDIPVPDAGTDVDVCGLEYELQGFTTTGLVNWTGPAGAAFNPDENVLAPVVTATDYGVHEFSFTADNNGCIESDQVTVTFIEMPVANSGADDAVCDLEYDLQAIPTVGTGSWEVPPGYSLFPDENDPNATVTAMDYGAGTLLWIENNAGCIDTAEVAIQFVEQPVANAGTDDEVCGFEANLNAEPSVGTGNWVTPSSVDFLPSPDDPDATVSVTTASSVDFWWIEDNGSGCMDSAMVTVNFLEIPVANAGVNDSICGLNAEVQAIPSVGTGGWTASPALNFSFPDQVQTSITAPDYGSYTLTWTEENGTGCSDTNSIEVVFSEEPVADAGADIQICGLEVSLNANPSVGLGEWSGTNVVFADTNDPNTLATVTNIGIYTLSWTEINGNCSHSDDVDVEFILAPVIDPGEDAIVCGLEYQLEATSTTGSGNWNFPTGISISDETDPNAEITADAEGMYTLYWVESIGPCSDSAAVTLEFVTDPVADAGDDEVICGLTHNLDAFSNLGSGTWSAGAGIQFGDISLANSTVTADDYGVYVLTWTVSVGSDCNDVDEVEITFVEAPVAEAGDDDEVCGLSYDLVAIPSDGDGSWSGPPEATFTDPTSPTTEVIVDAYGDYLFTWTETSSFGCTTSDQVQIAFYEQPVADPGEDAVVCGLDYDLMAVPSVGTGMWSTTDAGVTFTPNPADPTATIDVAVEGIYNLTWTETNGICESSASITVELLDQPAASAGDDDEVCGFSYGLSATGAGGQWAGSVGVIFTPSADDPNALATVPSAGEYIFTWSVDNAGICSDSDAITLNFYDTPAISGLTTTCINGNLNYIVNFTITGGDPATYNVTGDGILDGNVFTSDPLVNGATYSFDVQDGNACNVVVVSGSNVCPNLTYAGTMNQTPLSVCGDNEVTAIHNGNHTVDGNDVFQFILHSNPSLPLGTIFAENSLPVFSFQPGMVYGQTYYISSVVGTEDGMGGVDYSDPLLSVSAGTPVVFHETPTASVSGGGSACEGDTLWVSVDFLGAPPFVLTWTLSGQIQPPVVTSNNSVEIPLTETGQFAPIQLENDVCQGVFSGVANVQFAPIPNASIYGGGTICEGSTEELFVELTGQAPFEFIYAINGVPQPEIVTNLDNYSISAGDDGIYTLISVEDQVCTGETDGEAEMTVIPIPEVETGPDIEVCYADGAVQLGGDPQPGYQYSWNNSSFLSDPSVSNPLVVYNNNLTAPVELSFTLSVENDGCIGSESVIVTLYPTPVIQTIGAVSMCEGGAAQLQVTGASEIEWLPDEYITDNTIAMPFVFPPDDMEYSVSVSNTFGCSAEGTVLVTVNPMPEVNFASNVDTACTPAVVSFQNQTDPQFFGSCFWEFGNGAFSNSCNPNVSTYYMQQGVFDVSLTITTAEGCGFTATEFGLINTTGPIANFDYTPDPADISNPFIEFNNLSLDAQTYIWDFGDYGSSVNVNPQVEYPHQTPGEYEVCLVAIDNDGCWDEHCEVIEIAADVLVYVPNAFSPNGDGINDLFYPVMQGVDIVEFEFKIFNRRGHLIWETSEQGEKWDGADGTNDYLDDNQIYTWTLRIKDEYSTLRVDRSGSVMVIR